jgi:hypothetical protein
MIKLLSLIFTCFLILTTSVQATSSFYCEDTDNTILFIITPKNVHVVNDNEESDHPVKLNTRMYNNNLLLEISDIDNTLHISLDIKEDDLLHIASLQDHRINKNVRRNTQWTYRPGNTGAAMSPLLNTIYGDINYKNSDYSVHCKLDNFLSLGI